MHYIWFLLCNHKPILCFIVLLLSALLHSWTLRFFFFPEKTQKASTTMKPIEEGMEDDVFESESPTTLQNIDLNPRGDI